MANKVDELLKESGAVLIRRKKHEIWRLPNGKNFVRSKTPSSRNTDKNSFSDLRNLLGVDEERGKEGERRSKKTGGGRAETFNYTRNINTALADKLSSNGILEEVLKKKIQVLENQNKLLIEEVENPCIFCRIKNWIYAKFNT